MLILFFGATKRNQRFAQKFAQNELKRLLKQRKKDYNRGTVLLATEILLSSETGTQMRLLDLKVFTKTP